MRASNARRNANNQSEQSHKYFNQSEPSNQNFNQPEPSTQNFNQSKPWHHKKAEPEYTNFMMDQHGGEGLRSDRLVSYSSTIQVNTGGLQQFNM